MSQTADTAACAGCGLAIDSPGHQTHDFNGLTITACPSMAQSPYDILVVHTGGLKLKPREPVPRFPQLRLGTESPDDVPAVRLVRDYSAFTVSKADLDAAEAQAGETMRRFVIERAQRMAMALNARDRDEDWLRLVRPDDQG